MTAHHRSSLKNDHKRFKSKHSTKGAIKAKTKGKVEKTQGTGHRSKQMSKRDRKNLAKQVLARKKAEHQSNREIFEGSRGAPRIVTIIPLSSDVTPDTVASYLDKHVGIEDDIPVCGIKTVKVDRFRQKIQYVIPERNFMSVLDACQVADFVVFVMSANEEADEFAEYCLRCVESQGVSTIIGMVQHLGLVGDVKRQAEIKKSLFSYLTHFFPALDKLYSLDQAQDCQNAVRYICQQTPSGIRWRDCRSYMICNNVRWSPAVDTELSSVVLTGTLRGRPLSANQAIHIPSFGDYPIQKIVYTAANGETMTVLPNKSATETEFGGYALEDDELSDIDQSEAHVSIGNGQGVAIDDAPYLKSEAENADKANGMKKLPKGMSEYQSRWVLDDFASEDEFSDDEESSDSDMAVDEESMSIDGEGGDRRVRFSGTSEYSASEAGDYKSEKYMELSEDEEARQLKAYRSRAREDLDFPDEVELLPSQKAKDRFLRYRGLRSLQGSDWQWNEPDPRRPEEWRRMTKFPNYRATRNRVLKALDLESEDDASTIVKPGTSVDIYVVAPEFVASSYEEHRPFVWYSLLEYEQKQTLVNLSITPNPDYTDTVKSKDNTILQCGFRRFVIRPLFSQSGRSANNVTKFERYLHKDRTSTATVMAPVTFGVNIPCLYFKETPDRLDLVGTGSVVDTDFTRILAKRVILTGHPYKIHKKVVTIRYMFFNFEDVAWFTAVPLFTKFGRLGYIKESLGTHGYFKATFDRKINPQDTIGMALYKREWPRPSILWEGRR